MTTGIEERNRQYRRTAPLPAPKQPQENEMNRDDIKIGMKLEGQCATCETWHPVKVLRPIANSPDMFWVRIAYPDKTTAESILYLNELRIPTTETCMNEHAELIKEARELADRLWSANTLTPANVSMSTAGTIHALADIVEARDKELRFAENFKAIKDKLDALDQRIAVQAVNTEAVAACKMCAEVIAALLGDHNVNTQAEWINLRAAGHLAKRAAENADKVKGGA